MEWNYLGALAGIDNSYSQKADRLHNEGTGAKMKDAPEILEEEVIPDHEIDSSATIIPSPDRPVSTTTSPTFNGTEILTTTTSEEEHQQQQQDHSDAIVVKLAQSSHESHTAIVKDVETSLNTARVLTYM